MAYQLCAVHLAAVGATVTGPKADTANSPSLPLVGDIRNSFELVFNLRYQAVRGHDGKIHLNASKPATCKPQLPATSSVGTRWHTMRDQMCC